MKSQGKKVFVGVSGGVDSSVALALLQEQGYNVTGVFLKVWNPDWMLCNWRDERRSAMRVCATLGVPFMTLDCEKEYKELVVDYMIDEYRAGRTPNPDVFCNKYVKFGVFLKKALELGADYVATGHYAMRYEYTNDPNNTNGYELRESVDKEKDQSYFLYQLDQDQLAHTLFPVGGLHKSQVRELARTFALPTAEKKDSQGLCFIGKVDMKEFLAHYIDSQPGDVLNEKGEVIGRHDGAIFYTIGERHGFEITKKGENTERMFVIAKDMERNTITVSASSFPPMSGNPGNIFLKNMNWISGKEPIRLRQKGRMADSKTYDVRFRYRQEKQKCRIVRHMSKVPFDNEYELIPEQNQMVAPGQSAVIYDGEVCLGGGIVG